MLSGPSKLPARWSEVLEFCTALTSGFRHK